MFFIYLLSTDLKITINVPEDEKLKDVIKNKKHYMGWCRFTNTDDRRDIDSDCRYVARYFPQLTCLSINVDKCTIAMHKYSIERSGWAFRFSNGSVNWKQYLPSLRVINQEMSLCDNGRYEESIYSIFKKKVVKRKKILELPRSDASIVTLPKVNRKLPHELSIIREKNPDNNNPCSVRLFNLFTPKQQPGFLSIEGRNRESPVIPKPKSFDLSSQYSKLREDMAKIKIEDRIPAPIPPRTQKYYDFKKKIAEQRGTRQKTPQSSLLLSHNDERDKSQTRILPGCSQTGSSKQDRFSLGKGKSKK